MNELRETEDGGKLGNYDAVARRAMESLFRTFENFSEGTIVVDAHARVVWINKRYAARSVSRTRRRQSAWSASR